jgi:hypothetical protein
MVQESQMQDQELLLLLLLLLHNQKNQLQVSKSLRGGQENLQQLQFKTSFLDTLGSSCCQLHTRVVAPPSLKNFLLHRVSGVLYLG